MNAQQFVAEFAHVASAPGGIQQLRQMIYQLAVTGALAPQLKEDGDAHSLLSDVEVTRRRLIRENKYKRLPKLESEVLELPRGIDLPSLWIWTRLLDIGEINPRNVAKDEDPAAFVPMSGIPEAHRGRLAFENKKWGDVKSGFTHFADSDVIVAKITPCFENGKAAIVSKLENEVGVGAGTTELHVFRPIHPGILPAYVYLFVRSPYFNLEGQQNMTGTAGQKRLPTDYFATRAFPLPPTKEQSRIVAKVDELMILCDILETKQQQRQTLRHKVRGATLQAISLASAVELRSAWNRLADNFINMFHVPADVTDMYSLILDFALRGLLTQESADDEPAASLLDRSIRAKHNRIALGEVRVKKASSTDVIHDAFAIPAHWSTASLDDLFQFIDYRGRTPEKTSSGVVLVTAKNVRPGSIVSEPVEYISETSYKNWMTRGFPREGDLLITTEAPLGNVARIENVPNFALAQRVIDLQPFADLNTKCAMYFMMSPSFQNLVRRNSTGMTAKGIKAAKLKQLKLPIPPKEEQGRIVKSVERLSEMCRLLVDQLGRHEKVTARFAMAAVFSIVGISAAPEEEDRLKPPKTELIASLILGQAPDVRNAAPLATILAHHNGEMSAKDLWQRFGGEIDAFYAQLKHEVAQGWIREPAIAEMRQEMA